MCGSTALHEGFAVPSKSDTKPVGKTVGFASKALERRFQQSVHKLRGEAIQLEGSRHPHAT